MWSKLDATSGEVVLFPSRVAQSLYLWDTYRENGRYTIAGFDAEGVRGLFETTLHDEASEDIA